MPPSRGLRSLLWALLAFGALAIVWNDYAKREAAPDGSIGYSEFLKAAEAGGVTEAVLDAQTGEIAGKILKDGKETKFTTVVYPADLTLAERLTRWNVPFQVKPHAAEWIESFLYTWVPMILFALLFYYFFVRQIQNSGNRAFTFGKSNPKMASEGVRPKVTFKDVAGVEEAKRELEEVVEFLKDPGKFTRLGARIPKGVLLVGHPGCGKTLLAKAVAGEANVPFYSMSGSDFVEMFVGVGASRVRDIFEQGRKSAPCIIFIDEIDAVGRHRGWGLGGGHDEREQTLNALLVQMDGFDSAEGVILLAATNRPDILDPALLRPGRFDRRVTVDLPDLEGRLGILRVHTKKVPLGGEVELSVIARGTPFFSGADLANLVNESALLAAAAGKSAIGMFELESARDKVMMGPERRSRRVSEKEKRIVAVHEAGHALVAKRLPGTDPIHKVTLIPRGTYALGATFQLPERDKYLKSRAEYANDIAVLLGGRAAEDLVLGEITGGAASDLERATQVARSMVCALGMSRMGPLVYGNVREELFLGREIAREQNYSEDTAREIDQEIRRLVDEGDALAREVLTRDRATLEAISEALLDREILDGNEIDLLAGGVPLPPRARLTTDPPPENSETAPAAPRSGIVSAPQPAPLPA